MIILQPIHTIVLLAAILLIGKCYAYPMIRQRQESQMQECKGCGDDCDKCKYGFTVSTLCGIEECRKGPGDRCGGPNHSLGVCGEGMSCTCGRCAGCSVEALTCFVNPCPPYQIWEQRGHHEIDSGVYLDIHGNIRPPDGDKIRRMDERRLNARGFNME